MRMSICSHLSQVKTPKEQRRSAHETVLQLFLLGRVPQPAGCNPVVSGPKELLPRPHSEATSNAQQSHPPKYMPQKNLTSPGCEAPGEFVGGYGNAETKPYAFHLWNQPPWCGTKSPNLNWDLYCSLQANPFQTPHHFWERVAGLGTIQSLQVGMGETCANLSLLTAVAYYCGAEMLVAVSLRVPTTASQQY